MRGYVQPVGYLLVAKPVYQLNEHIFLSVAELGIAFLGAFFFERRQ